MAILAVFLNMYYSFHGSIKHVIPSLTQYVATAKGVGLNYATSIPQYL